MPSISEILGSKLVNKQGEVVDSSTLEGVGKVVGLYFSAHWCPPCRGFTPDLITFYNKYKAGDNGANFELVFVSSDKDEDQFKEYFGEMPWLALPFEDRDKKQALSKKFKVQGIPTFVLIDGANGALITSNGRADVADDPEGARFPWHPKTLKEMLSGKLLKGEEEVDFSKAIQDTVVGLYFSAHWCPPCRGFTPQLIETYETIRKAGKKFEMIFVSSDRSVDSFKDYFGTMPWYSIPYEDNEKKKDLSQHFGIEGIPTLVFLDENLEVISSNGRGIISKDKNGDNFPWPPQPVEELDDCTATTINEMCCMIYFTGGDEGAISGAKDLMTETAAAYLAERKGGADIPEISFMYEGVESDELSDSLHFFAQLPEHNPKIIVLDIPGQQKYVHPEGPVTKDIIASIAADYKSGKLAFAPLKAAAN